MRLVNGWVWINDLTNGTMWIAGTDIELERIDDWGNALGTDGDDPDEEQSGDDEETDTEENPDIGEIRDQEIDEDGVNEPPVARDDIARTRVDQPVVVDVVANDEDPDGDALMVTEITGVPEGDAGVGHRRSGCGAGDPGAGCGRDGRVRVHGVRRSWRDGLGEGVRRGVEQRRRQPATGRDDRHRRGPRRRIGFVQRPQQRLRPRRRHVRVERRVAPSGRVIFDPSGEITFTPDPSSSAGTIEVEYSILDAFGATANGLVRVAIRLDTSNNEPERGERHRGRQWSASPSRST